MINYLTTIQLKDAVQNDYDKLDVEMSKEAFAPVKQSQPVTQPIYREYKYNGGTTLQEVTAAAYRASRRVGKQYSFTVIKARANAKQSIFV
jgi:hypothetical protein